MYYVMCNDKQDVVLTSSSSVPAYKAKGYWVATIGTYQECQDFLKE